MVVVDQIEEETAAGAAEVAVEAEDEVAVDPVVDHHVAENLTVPTMSATNVAVNFHHFSHR